jgi:hypothetical protein
MRQGRHADIPNPQHLRDFAELVRMTIDFDLPIAFERTDTTVRYYGANATGWRLGR